MDENKQKSRLEELKKQVTLHNYNYHVLDLPTISDPEFDRLINELKDLEALHPDWITPDSPTQKVGGLVSERFNKVPHPAPILSLANAFSAEDLFAWAERIGKLDDRVSSADFVVEPKLDGLTVVLHYRNGLLELGATRGDGEIGEDITTNIKTVRSLPLRVPISGSSVTAPENLVVRGEVFINLEDFEELNRSQLQKGEREYQTPRNTAAGALRNLDSSITASRPLKAYIYTIITSSDPLPETQAASLEYLRRLGFPVSPYAFPCANIQQVVDLCTSWHEKRHDLPYEIDGMVVKLNNQQLSTDLGIVGKDPRGAIAYKFPAEIAKTKLLDIGVNVGRTGVLTPYAMLSPVTIGGVVVQQATLHNFDFIEGRDIRIGEEVTIKRAGDVIPYVIGPVIKESGSRPPKYQPPTTCPSCNAEVSSVPGEVALYCINPECPAQLIRNIEHFVSRSTLDIVGLGIKIVEQLVESGLVKNVADLYRLEKADLLALEGFAEKKADNLLASIEDSKQNSLGKLIFALGIKGVGEVVGEQLAREFGSLDRLEEVSQQELETLEGIGPNIAEAICDWFAHPANNHLLDQLKSVGMWPTIEPKSADDTDTHGIFSGKIFVITGTLPTLSRDEAKEFVQRYGGKVTSSVSNKTDFLLAGEKAGSKLTKAQELGIQILAEADLFAMTRGE